MNKSADMTGDVRKTTLYLQEPIYKALKLKAALDVSSMREIIENALLPILLNDKNLNFKIEDCEE